ncbi:hypothetical protein K438DRAFT_1839682 [Mycena galopus ATCC 62051]|nr:hypothetical protein K438DRAFT_1839682 [Mycena galopus ATCC 62051]
MASCAVTDGHRLLPWNFSLDPFAFLAFITFFLSWSLCVCAFRPDPPSPCLTLLKRIEGAGLVVNERPLPHPTGPQTQTAGELRMR